MDAKQRRACLIAVRRTALNSAHRASCLPYVLARSLQAFDDLGGRLLCPLLTSDRHRVAFACTAPPFGQALLTGTQAGSPQIRTCCVPAQALHLPELRFSSSVSRCHARSPGVTGLMKFLFVVWQVLARRCPATFLCWLTDHLRGLPLHGSLPPRSCLRLVLNLKLGFTFGMMLPVSNHWN